jgi:2'-5' RNA ligase superfamily
MGGGKTREGEAATADRLSQHWSWRPEWTATRRSWWWYATSEHDVTVNELAAAARGALEPEAPVDVIPPRWLHLSLAEVGFADDLPRPVPYECAHAARPALAGLRPLDLRVGPVTTMSGALVLDVRATGLDDVHGALLTAMAGTLGRPPEQRPFVPHVSVAYLHHDCDPSEVLDETRTEASRTGSTRLYEVALVEVVRDRRHYRWTPRCRLSVGPRRARHRWAVD